MSSTAMRAFSRLLQHLQFRPTTQAAHDYCFLLTARSHLIGLLPEYSTCNNLTVGLDSMPGGLCRWVRRELHCWVYDNVRAKWPTILRRPSRLPGLFSGYHAPAGLVHAVLRAVGVRLEDLAAETAAMGVRHTDRVAITTVHVFLVVARCNSTVPKPTDEHA